MFGADQLPRDLLRGDGAAAGAIGWTPTGGHRQQLMDSGQDNVMINTIVIKPGRGSDPLIQR